MEKGIPCVLGHSAEVILASMGVAFMQDGPVIKLCRVAG
jgi:hypothetical protein